MSTQVADRLTDFTDRISPMLVKELRQGLRAKAFVGVFLGLQIGLALLLLISVIGGSSGSSQIGTTISSLVFSFFAVAVLLVQPLRGTNALSSEISSNTIDLMVMTHLSAWRIVVGKWFAIVSQSILLFTSIVPYLILRYFLGGMDLFAELLAMTLILMLSATLTAITVGLSGANAVLLRGILPLVGCIALAITAINLLTSRSGFFMRSLPLDSPETYLHLGFMLIIAAFYAWSALDLGANMIAPMAENRSTTRRLVQIGTLLALTAVCLSFNTGAPMMVMLCLLSVPTLIAALTERNVHLPPQVAPFLKRKWLAPPFRWLLYPGWCPGVWFAGLWIVLCAACMVFSKMGIDDDAIMVLSTIFGTLLLPALILRLIHKKKDQNPFAPYLVILLLTMIVSMVVLAVSQALPRSERSLFGIFAVLPPYQWFIRETNDWHKDLIVTVSLSFTGIYLGALMLLSFTRIKEVRHVEHLAREHDEA